ncbi:MAG: hypothetical protein HGB12_07635 [Bacteroidetes bacterium]|nr:hypothetical protein [Bacteroidota bacterium]
MKTSFSIFSTDEVNRYGHQIALSALEDGVWQSGVVGLPMHLGHDMHRPTGWAIPFGIYLEPGIAYIVGRTLLAEDDNDIQSINKARQNVILKQQIDAIDPYKEDFIKLLGDNYSEDGKFHYPSCVAYIEENILLKVFPQLDKLAKNEKAGLIYLKDLLKEFEYLSQGVFKHKKSDLAIFAHSFFRKSLSRLNNFHFIFLDELIELSKNKDVNVRILLDDDMVGFAPSYLTSFEYEYWWGPKYNDDIKNIEAGLTQYGSDEFEKLYYSILRTEFYWKHDENNYEFELEEVKNEPSPQFEDSYGCRYVHSIYKKNEEYFDHFDGAIRSYDTETMLERIDSKMTEFGRKSEYKKIFRVDGKLPLSNWKSLTTNYLQGNPLIYEYFGLEKPEIKQVIHDTFISIKDKLVPYSIDKGMGIRMMVSYHEKAESLDYQRYISITDSLTLGEESFDAIEIDTYEIKKALNRLDSDLFIPENLTLLAPEDLYCNIPCIFHTEENSEENLNLTIEAFKMIFESLNQRGDEKVFSFTLAWNIEDKEVRISILGHVSDLYEWIKINKHIPIEREKFKKWFEEQAKFINTLPEKRNNPNLSEIVKFDGVLYLKRRLVNSDVDIKYKPTPEGLKYEMLLKEGQNDMLASIKNGEIVPATSSIIEEVLCDKSKLNYLESPYSTYLDNVAQRIQKFTPIGMYWTDKPAL